MSFLQLTGVFHELSPPQTGRPRARLVLAKVLRRRRRPAPLTQTRPDESRLRVTSSAAERVSGSAGLGRHPTVQMRGDAVSDSQDACSVGDQFRFEPVGVLEISGVVLRSPGERVIIGEHQLPAVQQRLGRELVD